MDRLYFGGGGGRHTPASTATFQYPLMDRLYFGGSGDFVAALEDTYTFQYPLMDRLYFGGRLLSALAF